MQRLKEETEKETSNRVLKVTKKEFKTASEKLKAGIHRPDKADEEQLKGASESYIRGVNKVKYRVGAKY